MVTTYDIAEKAGVSQATVSRVLNGSPAVRAETKQRVMTWVRKFDYQPNHAARSLAKKQSSLLGMVIPDVMNPYFSEVLKAVEQAADLNGYNLVLCDSRGNLQKEKQCLNVLRRHQVAGILLVPIDKEKSLLNIPKDWRMAGNMPVVVITQELNALDYVCVSHTRGGALEGSEQDNGTKYLSDMAKFFGIPSFAHIAADALDAGLEPVETILGRAIRQATALAETF